MPAATFDLYRPERDYNREELVAELATMPTRLRELLIGRDDGALQRRAVTGDWSPIEVVRHLRDIAQVYGIRFKWIIPQDDPFLPNYDEDRWVSECRDGPHEVESLHREIEAYRGETLRLLRSMPPDGWSRRGRHEVLGVVELEDYVRHQVAHEGRHLAQLQAAFD
jgi:hypothetical protein